MTDTPLDLAEVTDENPDLPSVVAQPSVKLPVGYCYGVTRYADIILREAFPQRFADLVATLEDDLRVDAFEEALHRIGLLIGLGSQRPEHDVNVGPDNLWALGDNKFWVIEAKTGARSPGIGKRDMGQLAQSMLWFGERYDPNAKAIPIMVHKAVKAYPNATPVTGMQIIAERGLGEFRAAVRGFAVGLVDSGSWGSPEVVGRLLDGHALTAEHLSRYLVPQRGVLTGT